MPHTLLPTIDVRRAEQRFATRTSWLDSRHSFSFGRHRDLRNTHFGLLLVNNHDVVQPDTGFDTHPHRDMEIVTWVLDGELEHKDSTGHTGMIHAGLAQRMSAGTGIWHSEMNRGVVDIGDLSMRPRGEVRFVQMWVVPDGSGVAPGYGQQDVSAQLAAGGLVPVAGGQRSDAAIRIQQQDAQLLAGRLPAGRTVDLPDAPWVHLYVARGSVELEGGGALAVGDAARLTSAEGPRVTAGPEGAEVLVWEMWSSLS